MTRQSVQCRRAARLLTLGLLFIGACGSRSVLLPGSEERDPPFITEGSGGSIIDGISPPSGGTIGASGGALGDGGQGGDLGGFGGADCAQIPQRGIEPTWVSYFGYYGKGLAEVSFPENERFVSIVAGQYQPQERVFRRGNGKVQSARDLSYHLLARDRVGRVELRSYGGAELSVFDLQTEQKVSALALSQIVAARLSADGLSMTYAECVYDEALGRGQLVLGAGDTFYSEPPVPIRTGFDCPLRPFPMVVDGEHRDTFFALPGGELLHRLDWPTQMIISASPNVDQQVPIMSVSLSDDSRLLATVGADEILRFWDPELFVERDTVTGVPVVDQFDNCYCDFVPSSPVAFSHDGTHFATQGPDGTIALRQSCDQAVVALLAAPEVPFGVDTYSSDEGAVHFAFSRDDAQIVALYPFAAAAFDL